MANWMPQGFVGQIFKAISKFIAPSGMPAPVLWGEEAVVQERLGYGISDLTMARSFRLMENAAKVAGRTGGAVFIAKSGRR